MPTVELTIEELAYLNALVDVELNRDEDSRHLDVECSGARPSAHDKLLDAIADADEAANARDPKLRTFRVFVREEVVQRGSFIVDALTARDAIEQARKRYQEDGLLSGADNQDSEIGDAEVFAMDELGDDPEARPPHNIVASWELDGISCDPGIPFEVTDITVKGQS
jgi:hypothetical protein